MLQKSCQVYLRNISIEVEHKLSENPTVKNFVDIVLDGLPRLPSKHDMELIIDIILGYMLILKEPY